jgi:hypothetical protein
MKILSLKPYPNDKRSCMKKIISALLLCILSNLVQAQSPVSYPKDTAISLPELNFEVFWRTFEDNYAFFKLRNVDWQKTYQQYRPKVNASISDNSLYAIFTHMVAPLKDDHVNVIMPGVKQFKAAKPSQFAQEFSTDSLWKAFWKMVNITLLTNGFDEMKTIGPLFYGSPLFYYTKSKQYGYLRFNRCFASQEADNVPDAAVAGHILDTVFRYFDDVKGLLIDVRDNHGGNDEFSYEVAGRFASKKMVGSYKKTRKPRGGYDELINPETWYIEPKGDKAFTGPVVLLTNDKTVSAADVFAMIMKELPQVKIIGENSRGIFSDKYVFTLPDKWIVTLSNQRYYNANMICYEGIGVPVDFVVENTRRDLVKMKDPVIQKALKEIRKR